MFFFSLKNIPWVNNLLEQLSQQCTNTILTFAHMALKLSNNKQDIESWLVVLKDQFTENFNDLLLDMKNLETETIKKIEKALNKLQELCKMLQINMPQLQNDKLTLYEELHRIKTYIAE